MTVGELNDGLFVKKKFDLGRPSLIIRNFGGNHMVLTLYVYTLGFTPCFTLVLLWVFLKLMTKKIVSR